jgi:predicted P-loop ATPase
MIKPHHLKEWIKGSGVSEQITRLNVESFELDHEIDDLLNRNTRSRWKSSDWGEGGWFVSGIEPKTGNQTYVGGQFKPDKPTGTGQKYLGISDSAANPLFLNTGDKDYWKNIIDDKSPIIITEGAKKAGALLTIGLPAISLSGVSTGQKLGRLRADLLPFFGVGRRVYLCFDSDIMTKKPVQQALDKLGRLISEKGAMVSVINLPQAQKGVDDFIVANGASAFFSLVDEAQTFEEWRKAPTKSNQSQPGPQQTDDTEEFFIPKQQRELKELRAKYAHRLRKNLRGNTVELDGEMLQPDYLYLQCLERDGVVVKKDMIIDTFLMFASQNEYDPVAEYLNTCYQKYGDTTMHLLENAADRYLHTNLPIYNTYLKKTLVGAVKRTFEAGCKFETALVIYGKQGALKSTFWRVLGGDWFDDTVQGFDRDEKQKLHQYWIEEFGEIEKVSNKHDVSQIKAFLSNQNDVFRVPFGRSSRAYPRKFIIVGSTNKPDILQDSTGDRRFWIIDIYHNEQAIDIDKVREERDQLWAAAYAFYKKGESVFLPREEDAVRDELNKQYRADDAWEEPVTNYVEHFTTIKMVDILKSCLEIPLERHDRKSQDRVSNILRDLGWVKVHTRTGKIWQKQESLGSLGSQPVIEPTPNVTYINNLESQNIYIGHKDSEKSCDPVTRDSCDPTKHDPKQNQNFKKKFKVGDRVTLKNGQEGCYITRIKLFNGIPMYHVENNSTSEYVYSEDILLLESEAIAIGDTVSICKANLFLDRFKRVKRIPNTLTVSDLGGAREAMCKNGSTTYQIPVDWIFKVTQVTP